jgi:hypothetical protein
LVQKAIVVGEHLDEVTHAFETPDELRGLMRTLKDKPVTAADIARRESVLLPRFSSKANAKHLINLIYS